MYMNPEQPSNNAGGTGVTITFGKKTARLVAAALEDWIVIMSELLNTVDEDDDDLMDGLAWNDIPLIAGAVKQIREAEAQLETK
jgi:hypothetical protein